MPSANHFIKLYLDAKFCQVAKLDDIQNGRQSSLTLSCKNGVVDTASVKFGISNKKGCFRNNYLHLKLKPMKGMFFHAPSHYQCILKK